MKSMWLLSLLLLFTPSPTFAQTPTNTLTVAPSIIRLDLATDKPEAELSYTNTSKQTIELTLSASDFTELEHGYKPAFLDEKNAENYKYSLSSWISFDKQTLVIEPNGTETVTVFINQERLTPGGHYGSILAQITNQDTTEAVQVQGALSSLLFVRTATGKEHEAGKIATFAPEKTLFAFPQSFVFRFQNTGDTDVIPYGIVQVHDMFGRVIAKGILNEGSLIALPESIRRFAIGIKPQGFLLPSIYTAEFTGHFGKSNQKMETKLSFFSEGSIPLIPTSIGIIIAALWISFRRKKA